LRSNKVFFLKDNILLFPDGTPKLADFGIARKDSGIHTYGMGTLLYMAPEVRVTKEYTSTIDIYRCVNIGSPEK